MTSSTSPTSASATSPTQAAINAAEELELDAQSQDEGDEFHNVQISPAPALSPTPAPLKSPSRVKAAAALWETASQAAGSTPPSPDSRPRLSPSQSFRSIPPSASMSTSTSNASSPEKPSSSRLGTSPSVGSSLALPSTPRVVDHVQATTPSNKRESFAEVTLDDGPVQAIRPLSHQSYSLSPLPQPPIDAEQSALATPVTAPAVSKNSFLSTALGFGLPSHTLHAPETQSTPQTASQSVDGPSTGWRSTMSTLLGGRSASATSPAPLSASTPRSAKTPAHLQSPSTEADRSSSFLLQRMASPTASRDRRISREVGATEELRKGFERVRNEMEDAAREMRKEEKIATPSTPGSAGGIDWVFWGAVVQDYEEVARDKPKELSKAIQQGVPAVIRGAIWQLMSSSKSAPLEETYKALLKLSSPHEKAIAKDLNRTFPNHKYFQQGGGIGQEGLYMVVKAYSLYDQEVGYTQGLAFIVAALLLNMPDEEAFCVLVRLMDSYNLRSHFLADMPGLQLRLFQFDRLVEELLPLLHTHFVKKGVKSSMFASQWFMTLFSYRFPLSLVYRVLDIVFAEGIEAIFRFSLALLAKSEDKLVALEFEQILSFLQADLFEVYRVSTDNTTAAEDCHDEEDWRANDFVRDAYDVRITPFMLDSYESEYEEQCRAQNKHALELDQLRNANRNLSSQVKQLEASLATINQEHVELVRQLVMSKIEKEETENELVRYKMLYAELAHAQQDALSTHSRFSAGSSMSQM